MVAWREYLSLLSGKEFSAQKRRSPKLIRFCAVHPPGVNSDEDTHSQSVGKYSIWFRPWTQWAEMPALQPLRYLRAELPGLRPEAALYLNTTVRFVRRLIAERRIAFHKFGGHVRLAVTDLDAFANSGRIEPITSINRVA